MMGQGRKLSDCDRGRRKRGKEGKGGKEVGVLINESSLLTAAIFMRIYGSSSKRGERRENLLVAIVEAIQKATF